MNDEALARVALTYLAEPGTRTVYALVESIGPVAALELLLRGDASAEMLGDALGSALSAKSGHALGDTLGATAGNAPAETLSDALDEAVGRTRGWMLGETAGGALGKPADGARGRMLGETAGGAPGDALGEPAGHARGGMLGEATGGAPGEPVGRARGGMLGEATGGAPGDALGETAGHARGETAGRALAEMVAARLTGGDPRRLAARALAKGERIGARLVVPGDAEWPRRLHDLVKLVMPGAVRTVDKETAPPLCLWVRGDWPLDEALQRSVAVVGSRAGTPYGLHVATEFGFGLASRGWSVVSGGAYGIDAAAHRGALGSELAPTVAVLACGVDRPYPVGNTALFERIAEKGLLVSEWPPGSEPYRSRFLIRNRVIAAATVGTVVVEAAARSGARQTLGRALEMRRHAMVVPGPVTSALSVGCHELLRERPETRLVTGFYDVLEEVGRIGADLAPVVRGAERPRDHLDDQATLLLDAMPRRGTGAVDALAARAGLDTRTALRKLSLLETLGFLTRRPGGYALAPAPKIPRQRESPP